MDFNNLNIAGIIPAAGSATRISPIPCSKEIFPVGFNENTKEPQVRVAASCLLESFYEAGADQIFMIIKKGKWDIPQYYGNGSKAGSPMAFIFTDPTPGTHYTVDLAYSFVRDRMILFGFPDILFKPKKAFSLLLDKQKKTGANVVLGLFKATNPRGADMVDIDEKGLLRNIIIKPRKTRLKYTWTIAVWTPAFSTFLHQYIDEEKNEKENKSVNKKREIYIGDVILEAIKNNLIVDSVIFTEGKYVDIGTAPDLKEAIIKGVNGKNLFM